VNQMISKLQLRKLAVRKKIHGMHKGIREARNPGSSFEFSDYRLYQFGDDIRQIDWNVYGRTEKYYIKRFLDEKEISVALYLDCSNSMQTDKERWQLAKTLAASFAFIALVNDDRLSFVPVGFKKQVQTRKGASFARGIFQQIRQLEGRSVQEPFTESCRKSLLKNRGLAIVITDGMEPIERWGNLIRRLAKIHPTIRLMRILSKEEIEPHPTGDYLLVDSETKQEVNVTLSPKVIQLYHERLRNHDKNLERLCLQYGVSYMQVSTEENVADIVFGKCLQNGWLE